MMTLRADTSREEQMERRSMRLRDDEILARLLTRRELARVGAMAAAAAVPSLIGPGGAGRNARAQENDGTPPSGEGTIYRPATPENLKQAGLHALQAARRDPRDWRPPFQLGRALLKQNEPAEAAKLLEQSVKMQATPDAVYQLSLAYARAGNTERAKHYGGIYQRWNDFAERRKVLLGEVQREPREVGHYYRLAELYLKASAPDPAENWLKKAQALKKDDRRFGRMMAQVRRLRESGSDAPLLPVQ